MSKLPKINSARVLMWGLLLLNLLMLAGCRSGLANLLDYN